VDDDSKIQNRLRHVPYHRTEVLWDQVCVVCPLKQGDDGCQGRRRPAQAHCRVAVRAAHSSGRALGPWAWDLGPRGLGASGPWDDCLGVGARRGGAQPPPWPLVIAACGMRQAAVIGLHVAAKAPSGKKTKTEMLWGTIRRYCHDRPQHRPSTLVSQREPGKTDGLP
jgi:hypothetical protein